MRILRTIAEMRAVREGLVGFVPTMGAFHEGHLSLMRRAKSENDLCVASLFVNPTQFGPNEDFERYPRDEARDAELARGAGVDILFAPSVSEIYPRKTTIVSVAGVSEQWEGAKRPGHFDGVSTVVCKLFNIVRPNVAYFGKKDLQQCAVVKRMVEDLNLPLELRFCETYREEDGLAMSSRNAYLSPENRAIAPELFRELSRCRSIFQTPVTTEEVQTELLRSRTHLSDKGFLVDYFALVDTSTLEPVEIPSPGDSVIVAAKIGSTRLIDNVQI